MIRQLASSTKLSSKVIRYLVDKGFSQEKIAQELRLTPSMISHVLKERKALSLDSLQRVEAILNAPLGAILLDVSLANAKPDKAMEPLVNSARKFMESADRARQAIKKSLDSTR